MSPHPAILEKHERDLLRVARLDVAALAAEPTPEASYGPMPAGGWTHAVAFSDAASTRWLAAEVVQRRYYGPLFDAEGMGV